MPFEHLVGMYALKVTSDLPDDIEDNRYAELEQELYMGFAAVAQNIVDKFPDLKLTAQVKF